MKLKSLIILLFALATSSLAHAAWRKQCLENCFSTGHDCQYCDWACATDNAEPKKRAYSDPPCPFSETYQDR